MHAAATYFAGAAGARGTANAITQAGQQRYADFRTMTATAKAGIAGDTQILG
jgi:hypothetical protein